MLVFENFWSIKTRLSQYVAEPIVQSVRGVRASFEEVSSVTGLSKSAMFLDLIAESIPPALCALLLLIFARLDRAQEILVIILILIFSIYRMRKFRVKIIRRYRESIESELASFIEMMSLAVNSGLSFVGAFMRITDEYVNPKVEIIDIGSGIARGKFRSRISHISPLQRELDLIRKEVRAGGSVSHSLDLLSARLNSAMVTDFVDAVVLTMARGTPLAEQLNNHAQSIREYHGRILLERAGRAEVKMMMPVVFLLLPISVLFALWPSFQQLQQMVVIV